MSSTQSRHPLYLEHFVDWAQLRDTYRGERVVKERRTKYLPFTSGMIVDGAEIGPDTPGGKAYTAYLRRAVFPELFKAGVEAMLGVMHHKPPAIELPASMEPLRERATLRNESLEALLRRINEEQLVTGRVGLLLEVPDKKPGPVLPHVALYQAEDIINWDDGDRDDVEVDSLQLVVLDESEEERTGDGFSWERVEKYRVLVLGELIAEEAEQTGALYRVGVFRETADFSEAAMVEPSIAGRKLEELPFVFVNTKDIVATPDDAPLIGLSNITLTIYRGEADYRQALFMQGQDTLVRVGATSSEGEETRVGAGATIDVPMGGDAKFIGVSSAGLPEMRSSLENDYARGNEKATALLEAVSRAAESGEALRVRVSARTASLNQIAMTGAFALQELLRKAARWIGANPDEVIVTPNLDFVSDIMPGAEVVALMTAKSLGAPLSLQSVHEALHARGLTEKTWEEELEQLELEAEEGLPGSVAAGSADAEGATEDGDPVDDGDLVDGEDPEDDAQDDDDEGEA